MSLLYPSMWRNGKKRWNNKINTIWYATAWKIKPPVNISPDRTVMCRNIKAAIQPMRRKYRKQNIHPFPHRRTEMPWESITRMRTTAQLKLHREHRRSNYISPSRLDIIIEMLPQTLVHNKQTVWSTQDTIAMETASCYVCTQQHWRA